MQRIHSVRGIVTLACVSFLMLPELPAQLVNIAPAGTATQTSNYPCCGGFPAELAIDLLLGNFTATAPDDPAPTWEVELPESHDIRTIIVRNRGDGCCPERLRDITVSILSAAGGAVEYTTDLLNPGNVLGSPPNLEIDLVALTGAGVDGRVVTVARTPDLGEGGDGGFVMSLGEVEVLVADAAEPLLIRTQPRGGRREIGGSFVFTVEATGPMPFTYQWKKGVGDVGGATTSTLELMDLELGDSGVYTVVVTGGGQTVESDPAELTVTPVNLARGGLAIQSSDYGPFVASIAIDGNYGNFTATGAADENPRWELDLGGDAQIDEINVFNRGDGCCQSRLRDIVVSIHDVSFLVDPESPALFETDILNEENVLGGGTLAGPALLSVDVSPAVTGRYVRVARIPDPDLSGTGGLGGGDEVAVHSIGEVEVFGDIDATCPVAGNPEFADTHCTVLTVQGPGDDGPGPYDLTATAVDGTLGDVLYTFRAENGFNMPITVGPSLSNTAQLVIPAGGPWTFSVTVDDSLLCADAAADATCTEVVDVTLPDGDNKALLRPARQSSDFTGAAFLAPDAVDGNLGNFTATGTGDAGAYLEVNLAEDIDITSILVYNRGDNCCQSRLRDITVSIRDAGGSTVLFESELLNPENELGGGGLGGPPLLSLDIVQLAGAAVRGRIVRVHRAPDPDLSGTGGQGNADEPNVLSIGELEVYDTVCGEGIARCSDLTVDGPDGSGPGVYTASASGTGDPIFYTFRAQKGQDPPQVIGPTDVPAASFNLDPGDWTISVTVGDSRRCANSAAGATCSEDVTVEPLCVGENVALAGAATQSTNYPCCGGFPAGLAIDGNLGNFTATAADDPAPEWEVDLGSPKSIATIVLYNRGDGCCQERLRDITVAILDAAGAEIEFQSELLNPANTLGGPPYLALKLTELAGGPVSGQVVRVTRTPDPNAVGDDASLLSLGEVEICTGSPPAGNQFHRGDADDNGTLQLTDAVRILGYLFLGAPAPPCLDAADADDDGRIQLTDAVRVLGYLFLGAVPPAPPGPPDQPCGTDDDEEDPDLGCIEYTQC